MLLPALVVGIAGWLTAQEPVPRPPAPAQVPVAAPTPRAQAEQFVLELAEPGKQNAAVAGLVALGDTAVPALHKALVDRRSDVLQWALFACSGLQIDCASLRPPVERLLASKDLGVALMARRAWPTVEGRSGVLLTLLAGNVELITADGAKVLLSLPQPSSRGRGAAPHRRRLPEICLGRRRFSGKFADDVYTPAASTQGLVLPARRPWHRQDDLDRAALRHR